MILKISHSTFTLFCHFVAGKGDKVVEKKLISVKIDLSKITVFEMIK